MIKINIAEDFTITPGGRYIKNGDYSGEQFREEILIPKYEEARDKKEKLIIDLDGGYGYPTSFVEEAFGGLARKLKDKNILNIVEIISNDAPHLINDIKKYVSEAK